MGTHDGLPREEPPIGSLRRYVVLITLAAVGVAAFFALRSRTDAHREFVFAGVRGPSDRTVIAPPSPARWEDYDHGGPSRLAILLTDPDSAWLGLVHGLKSIGVPFRITRDYREAMRHRVVLVYPTISGRALPAEALRELARLPARGGTLIGVNVEGGGLEEVFGFRSAQPSRARREIKLDATQKLNAPFTDPREQVVRFSGSNAMGSLGYVDAKSVLARFDDGSAAITARSVGSGYAYAVGIDPGFFLLTGYNNREEGVARAYVNEYEPALDVVLRLVREMYRQGEPAAVTLHTVPEGKALSVLLTHDVDFTRSLANAPAYAEYEASMGLKATYFIQTKYVRDWNDDVYFNQAAVPVLEKVRALGMELASHSVAHSMVYNQLPLGSGDERYPGYRPIVYDEKRTEGATVLGELRISRFLLETLVPGLHVDSFRPGHLRNPYSAPQAMQATGYRFSSSVTANNSLTHLPFRLTYARDTRAATAMFEFPVSVEDERKPPLAERLPEALALADRLSRYGGLFTVLIHTEVVEPKLGFEKKLVEALRGRAWFGTVRAFGTFWAARDRAGIDVVPQPNGLRVELDLPDAAAGLTLEVPQGMRVAAVEPAELGYSQRGQLVVLQAMAGKARLRLEAAR